MNQRVLIEKNYLRIPIRKDAVEKNVWLYQELTAVLQFQAGLFCGLWIRGTGFLCGASGRTMEGFGTDACA
mgnify:CR=1 FL=1